MDSSSDLTAHLLKEGEGEWILIEDGNLKGMNIIVDDCTGNVLSFSTRFCREAERWIGEMPSLQAYPKMLKLDLYKSRYITDLHESVGYLGNLKKLDLTRCECLERLPDSIGGLGNLQEVSSAFLVVQGFAL
jgi:hypothetical protein